MAHPKTHLPAAPPPLVAWPTWKLVAFAVLLPLTGAAILGLAVAGLARTAGTGAEWFEADDPVRAALVIGWLLVLGLGMLGFSWAILLELRRRRRFPSPDEQRARRAAAEEGIRWSLDIARSHYRTGWLWFLVGVPGLGLCLGYRWLGSDPPQWATFLTLPLAALAPLYWMAAIRQGVWLWFLQGRPSRWLGYASLTFAAFFVAVFVVAFSYLRG